MLIAARAGHALEMCAHGVFILPLQAEIIAKGSDPGKSAGPKTGRKHLILQCNQSPKIR
jgi:hypothetical protein